MEFPLVSVVMNCYNCEKYLKEAIDSVYAQTYKNWEIIFIDDFSIDRSAVIAQQYNEKLKYYKTSEKIKLGAARNVALEKCQGALIAFLDCDDLWLPTKLEKQVPLFSNGEVGLVFSNCISFNAEGQNTLRYKSRNDYAVGSCFPQMLSNYFVMMPTAVMRRDVLQTLGQWFDPEFEVAEEGDLFSRIAYSWKLDMVNEALAKYRVHSGGDTWNKSKRFFDEYELMLTKYRKLIPDFDSAYKDEIVEMKRKAYFIQAALSWVNGNGVLARKYLNEIGLTESKSLILYLASFVPIRFVKPLLYRKGLIVP
ncbi:MAG: glycosyltransferase family 2 protein [Sulfuricella sp.]|nr:glycosyltransferase family 2 protein [Sulfuricella sp.]